MLTFIYKYSLFCKHFCIVLQCWFIEWMTYKRSYIDEMFIGGVSLTITRERMLCSKRSKQLRWNLQTHVEINWYKDEGCYFLTIIFNHVEINWYKVEGCCLLTIIFNLYCTFPLSFITYKEAYNTTVDCTHRYH